MLYKGRKLTEKQREIANGIVGGDALYNIVCCSRQFGKSFLMQEILKWACLNNSNWQCCYVTMTYAQSHKVYKEFLEAIRGAGLVRKYHRQEKSIVLKNGSEIYFKSYQNSDAIRGYSFDCLIIDEAAFIKEEDWASCFRPTLTVKGKKCVLASTPRGRNFFYNLFQMAAQNSHYRAFTANYNDNPFANVSEVEAAREALPDTIFRTEYLAEFVDGGGSVFDGFTGCIGLPSVGGRVVAGVDVGRRLDFTVLSVFNGNKLVHFYRKNSISWEKLVKEIADELKAYRVEVVAVETNGVGDVFYELLEKAIRRGGVGCRLVPFTTTNTTKQNAVELLAADIAAGAVSLPDDQEMKLELEMFSCDWSAKSHAVKYEARQGFHDDIVISMAIANHTRHNYAQAGKYFFA